ncbi:DUF2254 domain-containing protein [Ramlibacter rhizophilus]|uniref:DUF2254 domain-containing protein n=1 Tax=Ramlibacter rhizophilus TaxID=1781167 RepID=A0A4Z0BYD3_9BURK|nr:DUF2254 domain-containing protein [Ramlibacter rhizophilus]TFZ04347.1 DUF2254 domain-containing protein [Ramlibacter rhizophilus]
MYLRADIILDRLRTGIWPLPAVMMLGGGLLFRGAMWADQGGLSHTLLPAWWVHGGSVEDARSLMSTLVAAMITMASLVFSITVVTLTLAASQYGSRLVRSYVRDRRTHFTLGLFAMTILYGLLALKVVGAGPQAGLAPGEPPHLTVTLGVVLGVVCVLAMLVFLHTIAHAIVADEVIRRVAAELEASIATLSPDGMAPGPPPGPEPPAPHLVLSRQEGYVEAVRYHELLARTTAEDGFVRLSVLAGQFVARGDAIARYARPGGPSEAFATTVARLVLIGPERTPVQDLAYSLRHLVDVALRALSPALNDENTAIVVIDRLRGALSRLLRKRLPSGYYVDAQGTPRVQGPRYTHQDHIQHAIEAIRRPAAAHPRVVVAAIDALALLVPHAADAPMRHFLLGQAERVAEAGLQAAADAVEREAIEAALSRARKACGEGIRSGARTAG